MGSTSRASACSSASISTCRCRMAIVGDTTRIDRVLPTIKQLLAGGAKVIVLSHLGRPKAGTMPDTSLGPIAAKIARADARHQGVSSSSDCVGDEAKRGVDALQPGEVARARKSSLPRRREEERSGLRQTACRARRHLCQRRLLHRASRACLGRGASRIFCRPMPAS